MSLDLSNKNLKDVEDIFNEIESPEKYFSIDLSNNLLTSLPKNISIFKSLNTLDLINNKFTDYNSISITLSSLPKLENLNIDLSTQENVLIILTALPGLLKLNGQIIEENSSLQQSIISQNNINENNIENNNNDNEKKFDEISLNEETGEFEFIYKELDNKEFNKKFQEKLREEISKINNNIDIPNKLYNAIIVKSKLEIYSFILDEVLNLLSNKDINNINNFDKIVNIMKIVKEKLKNNQNILFEIFMSDINNKDNNKNNNTNLNSNIKNSSFEISNEISFIDCLNEYNDDINSDKIKVMAKNNLIILLDQIYEYKVKNNLEYKEAFIPFLTAKYGMESLANFWYNKIIEGINYYIDKEKDKYSEIFIVKLILENKIDEFFYFKYKKAKIKYNNYINKIKTLLESNKNNEIISYEDIIKFFIDNFDNINNDNNNKDINKEDVIEYFNKNNKFYENNTDINNFYDDFINFLMEIYIQKRLNIFNIYLNNFHKFDKDNDGFINKEEFIELIYSFKNEYIINNNTIITTLCSELFKNGKMLISINDFIEVLSKKDINNKNLFNVLLSSR